MTSERDKSDRRSKCGRNREVRCVKLQEVMTSNGRVRKERRIEAKTKFKGYEWQ